MSAELQRTEPWFSSGGSIFRLFWGVRREGSACDPVIPSPGMSQLWPLPFKLFFSVDFFGTQTLPGHLFYTECWCCVSSRVPAQPGEGSAPSPQRKNNQKMAKTPSETKPRRAESPTRSELLPPFPIGVGVGPSGLGAAQSSRCQMLADAARCCQMLSPGRSPSPLSVPACLQHQSCEMCVGSELTFNCSWCHVLQRYRPLPCPALGV